MHCGGSKSFAQYQYELRNIEIGQLSGWIDVYQRTHHRTMGEWLPETRKRHDCMMEIRSQSLAEGSIPPTDDDIYDKVLSRRPSYVTRLGYGIMAPSSSRAAHVFCDARLHEAERRHAEIKRRYQKEIADLRRANAKLSSQLQVFGAKLDELYHRMPLPPTFDVPTDAYDQESIDDDDNASSIGNTMSTVTIPTAYTVKSSPSALIKSPCSLSCSKSISKTSSLKISNHFRASAMAVYKVKLIGPEGQGHEFDAPDDTCILDSAEAVGVELPYSCRAVGVDVAITDYYLFLREEKLIRPSGRINNSETIIG
ncbi:hypothetical protein COCNU_05G006030 [Cocos nucifera]|uniref:2Fe-2S ferredoxin-type domain-containing protein n=1 Tax=Cocos nucifera TaxID=13894 RepID=A0A8K0N1N6_COCNU|nr:hypothetical protein COCNU_05G006030 [Cocos nucifera]